MAFESQIPKSLSQRQDIYTLKLDMQAEKEYLEKLRPALQANRDDYRNIRFFLNKATHLVNKNTEKEKTQPALRKDKRWLRTAYRAHKWQIQAQERRDALQREYATLLKDHKEHTEILQSFQVEYKERVRVYAIQFYHLSINDSNTEFSPEEIEKAEKSFLRSTFS